jgi:Uma2 family endonuclease
MVVAEAVLEAKPKPKLYTPEEYLALEVESEVRHEYRNGEILVMAGGLPTHNEIAGDLLFLFKAALKQKPYSVFVCDQRLLIPGGSLYTYPDVMVVPRPVELQAGRKDTITNPILIAEILSDSTKDYDRGDKFISYRSIPSFQEYLLISQDAPHVEHHVKQNEKQWLFTEYDGLEETVKLSSIGVEIALADLYENVNFNGPLTPNSGGT